MNGDEILTWAERLFLLVFVFLYFGVPALLVWGSYCEKCKVDLRALWTHNNRPDKLAVIILGTWWIHSTTVILWSLSRTVNSQDFLIYMGWAVPVIAKMIVARNGEPPKDKADPTQGMVG